MHQWKLLATAPHGAAQLPGQRLRKLCARAAGPEVPRAVFHYGPDGVPLNGPPRVRFVGMRPHARQVAAVIGTDPDLFFHAACLARRVINDVWPGATFRCEHTVRAIRPAPGPVFYRIDAMVVRSPVWAMRRHDLDWARQWLGGRVRHSICREARALGINASAALGGHVEVLAIRRTLALDIGVRATPGLACWASLVWLLVAADFELVGDWFAGRLTARGYGRIRPLGREKAAEVAA